jgi:N-succinyldiaminopimelate aminotransferase
MKPELSRLQAYPFERLNQLLSGVTANPALHAIQLSIGEPKHAPPPFVLTALQQHLDQLGRYPVTRGEKGLRETIALWLQQRFNLPSQSINPESQVLPVAGTREALFAFAQAVIRREDDPCVVMPNPFYQIYEGAALLAGATPWFMNTTAESGFLPDLNSVPREVWQRCQLLYLCSPGNPTGAVAPMAQLQQALQLAEEHDFIIAADECYSEIYRDESAPPIGMLTAAHALGNSDFKRCVVFHSLSKRSNLPGLRSGFVAGDAEILRDFLLYRTYHGCALPLPTQHASRIAWGDEEHVVANRRAYREKFTRVSEILAPLLTIEPPEAGFYLWLPTPYEDSRFCRDLYQHENLLLLPGSYLSRESGGINPGQGYARMALVASLDDCVEAARRLRRFMTRQMA